MAEPHEEEYRLPDEGDEQSSASMYGEEVKSARPMQAKKRGMFLPLVLGVVIVGFSVHKLLDVFRGTAKPQEPKQVVAKKPANDKKAQKDTKAQQAKKPLAKSAAPAKKTEPAQMAAKSGPAQAQNAAHSGAQVSAPFPMIPGLDNGQDQTGGAQADEAQDAFKPMMPAAPGDQMHQPMPADKMTGGHMKDSVMPDMTEGKAMMPMMPTDSIHTDKMPMDKMTGDYMKAMPSMKPGMSPDMAPGMTPGMTEGKAMMPMMPTDPMHAEKMPMDKMTGDHMKAMPSMKPGMSPDMAPGMTPGMTEGKAMMPTMPTDPMHAEKMPMDKMTGDHMKAMPAMKPGMSPDMAPGMTPGMTEGKAMMPMMPTDSMHTDKMPMDKMMGDHKKAMPSVKPDMSSAAQPKSMMPMMPAGPMPADKMHMDKMPMDKKPGDQMRGDMMRDPQMPMMDHMKPAKESSKAAPIDPKDPMYGMKTPTSDIASEKMSAAKSSMKSSHKMMISQTDMMKKEGKLPMKGMLHRQMDQQIMAEGHRGAGDVNIRKLAQAMMVGAGIDKRIDRIEQRDSQMHARISQIEENMMKLQKGMMMLNTNMHRLSKQLMTHAEAKRQMMASKIQAETPRPRDDSDSFHLSKQFYIQAIIPGRAWIKDRSGNTLSVAIGDKIPGFGRVTRIDPEQGVVLTSGGLIIHYGIEQG